jgi:hypothetical protein
MAPATYQLFGFYEPAEATGRLADVGLRWRGFRVEDPTIVCPTTGASITVEEALCCTPRGAARELCSRSPASCWKSARKEREIKPCPSCTLLGVTLAGKQGPCKFCWEKVAQTSQPWLALTAASVSPSCCDRLRVCCLSFRAVRRWELRLCCRHGGPNEFPAQSLYAPRDYKAQLEHWKWLQSDHEEPDVSAGWVFTFALEQPDD